MNCTIGVAPFQGRAEAVIAAVFLSDVVLLPQPQVLAGAAPVVRSIFIAGARSSLSAVAPDHIFIEGGLAAA